ncbi:TetR/AcrR family transcriptional regulator [Nonomuraea spiralis]|uniref:TetR/AcrR family transcriptional regulator n=1 Tax=Nonomuraea TaxID=83681 RepID=UPI000F77BD42|nr:TetR/AcrR family transcriptional regulator [Nonomuraea sp. WAC 01424]RSN15668.1 TetR family transcriptional regulator [Nonomuraea sp. WAC 01424]
MTEHRDRRAVLADAAIELVAARGIRGLTHRAVDAQAGMPSGTTSAYYRTWKALLTGLVRRLADLDRIDLERRALAAEGPLLGEPQDIPVTADGVNRLAEATAAVIDHWLSAGRTRTLARHVCALEAAHDPELRELLAPHNDAARASASAFLARAGVRDTDRRGRDYVACINGLILDRLVGVGASIAPLPGTQESRDELHQSIRSLLEAMIRPEGSR